MNWVTVMYFRGQTHPDILGELSFGLESPCFVVTVVVDKHPEDFQGSALPGILSSPTWEIFLLLSWQILLWPQTHY